MPWLLSKRVLPTSRRAIIDTSRERLRIAVLWLDRSSPLLAFSRGDHRRKVASCDPDFFLSSLGQRWSNNRWNSDHKFLPLGHPRW
jgi:hypothetical protein